LKAEFFVGGENTSLEYLNSKIKLTMNYDIQKAGLRRIDTITLGRYDDYKNTWEQVAQKTADAGASLTAYVDRLGRFMIIGSRR